METKELGWKLSGTTGECRPKFAKNETQRFAAFAVWGP
jgi:hypothetical protein